MKDVETVETKNMKNISLSVCDNLKQEMLVLNRKRGKTVDSELHLASLGLDLPLRRLCS